MVLPPKWRRPRFLLKVLAANLLVFSLAFVAGETAVRIWREGGVVAGLRSFVAGSGTPHTFDTRGWLLPDAELGYTLNPAQEGISSLCIRHPELATPKPPGAFRLLILGDSVAWPDDGFVAKLTEQLHVASPSVEVINASVPGYTTCQERLHLERIVAKVSPDVVVLQYCLNDHHRYLHQLRQRGDWLITQEARRSLLPEGEGLLARLQRWSYLLLEIRLRWLAWQRPHGGPFPWQDDPAFGAAWQEDGWRLVAGELDAMHARLQQAGARFLILAVPYGPQLADAALSQDRDYTLRPQANLAAWCKAHGTPFLDLHPRLLPHRDEDLFLDGIHFTDNGHQLVANELLAALRQEHLLPAR